MKRSRKASGIATCFAVVAISPALVGFAGSAASGVNISLPSLPPSPPVISASGIADTPVPLAETPEVTETEEVETKPIETEVYTDTDTEPILPAPEQHNLPIAADERVSEQTLHYNDGDVDVSDEDGTARIRNHSDFSDTEVVKFANAESDALNFARDGSA